MKLKKTHTSGHRRRNTAPVDAPFCCFLMFCHVVCVHVEFANVCAYVKSVFNVVWTIELCCVEKKKIINKGWMRREGGGVGEKALDVGFLLLINTHLDLKSGQSQGFLRLSFPQSPHCTASKHNVVPPLDTNPTDFTLTLQEGLGWGNTAEPNALQNTRG